VPEPHIKEFHRRDFYSLKENLDDIKIMGITGPRQVGKTTLMYQFIENLIEEGEVDPLRILFVSFDYPYLTTVAHRPINDVLEAYADMVLKEPIEALSSKIYVFLDEICSLEDWSKVLKGWYDLKYPIKFIISDSSSASMLKGSAKHLVGRIDINIMLSLKFIDFIGYHDPDFDYEKISLDLREAFKKSMDGNDPSHYHKAVKTAFAALAPREKNIQLRLQDYFLKDGYPELLDESDLAVCRKRLYDYINLTLYKDLIRNYEIRSPKMLEDLLVVISGGTAQRVNVAQLSDSLSLKRDTVTKFLEYLESVFLVSRCDFYTTNRASRIKKSKKLYVNNVGIRNVLVSKLDEQLLRDPSELGRVVETIVHDHARRLRYCLLPGDDSPLFYWNNRKGEEVDMVFEYRRKPVPIEVKYRKDTSDAYLKGIRSFMAEKKTPFGVVVTKNTIDLKDNVVHIPLWLFLIMC